LVFSVFGTPGQIRVGANAMPSLTCIIGPTARAIVSGEVPGVKRHDHAEQLLLRSRGDKS